MSNQTLDREQVLAKALDLGIAHNKRAKTVAILKMINDLTGESHVEEKKKTVKTEGFTRCIIHSNDKDNDEAEMTLALLDDSDNQRIQVKIGEEFKLDNKFIPVLKDAVIERHISVLDEAGEPTGKTKIRKEPRYIMETV